MTSKIGENLPWWKFPTRPWLKALCLHLVMSWFKVQSAIQHKLDWTILIFHSCLVQAQHYRMYHVPPPDTCLPPHYFHDTRVNHKNKECHKNNPLYVMCVYHYTCVCLVGSGRLCRTACDTWCACTTKLKCLVFSLGSHMQPTPYLTLTEPTSPQPVLYPLYPLYPMKVHPGLKSVFPL